MIQTIDWTVIENARIIKEYNKRNGSGESETDLAQRILPHLCPLLSKMRPITSKENQEAIMYESGPLPYLRWGQWHLVKSRMCGFMKAKMRTCK